MLSDLERFEELCDSLRRNDPRTTELDTDTYNLPLPNAYGRRLGEALEGNTHVSSMTLWLHNVLADDEGVDSADRLLRYISENVSMRKIELRCVWNPRRPEVVIALLRLALRAISESSSIEELILWTIRVASPDTIALLLRTTQSLKTLSICIDDFDFVASRELVAEAFGANRTLECLELLGDGSSTHTVESVLLHLGSHPVLRKLKLFCGTSASVAQIRALEHFLHTTSSLEQLELRDYCFDRERMEHFVEGLQSSRSLVKLMFYRCMFDLEATQLFHGFMQTGETMSSIRELSFHNSRGMFAGSSTGRVAAAFVTAPENHHMGSCIASALQVLNFDDDIAGFYDTSAANAFRIRLPCVHHECMTDNDSWEALVRCLPKLVYHRELRIRWVLRRDFVPRMSARIVVDALRQNGSLRVVEIAYARNDYFDEAQGRLIRSYCKRNEAIPTLVANPRPDATAIALFPKLFVASKQARRTAPNAILLGLLTAGDAFGPRQDRKRPHQEPSA